MALLVSRAVAEVLGTPNKTTHITRFGASVATSQGTGGTALVARHVGEVLGESPPPGVSFTRLAAEVATTQGTGGTALVARHVGEVLGANEKRTDITRFAATVATSQAPAGTGFVQVSRQVAEVLGAGVTPYDAPPAPGRIDLFDQNWLSGISIRTVFKTDVGSSPETGDESRVGLADRPVRHVTVQWTVHTEAEHSRLLDLLKDLTDEETSIPLMVDLSTLTQNQPAGTTVLQLSTRQRRFFLGAYAFVLYRNYRCNIVNWQLVQIVNKTDTSVTISPGLSADGKAGLTCLAPALIVEPISESTITLPGKEVWQVETEFEEVASWALPASNDAIPDGLFSFEGLPILSEEPNNAEPIEVTISRPGERMEFGRGVYVEGLEPRHREEFLLSYSAKPRPVSWQKLQLFESRRGRLRPWWLASPYQIPAVTQVLGVNYVDVLPAGDLAAFTRDLSHIAVVTQDGSTAVREVSGVALVLGVWRISILGTWPPAVQGKVIARVVRAYLVRFSSDEFTEHWDNGDHCSMRFRAIELIEERPIAVQP